MTTTPASVSARLRRLGFSPIGSGSKREGLKVKSSIASSAVVVADLDSDHFAVELSTSAFEALESDGLELRRTSPTIFYVH